MTLSNFFADMWGRLFPPPEPVMATPKDLYDRRKFAAQAHGDEHEYKVTGRKWREVTGICLHQTACMLGERPQRYDSVGAHVCITRSGKVIWLHDFNRRVVHGNGWNNQTVGIEIDGLYAGIQGDQKTVWDDPSTPHREVGMELTGEAMLAARQAIRWICDEVKRNGGQVKVLVAHRQSSLNRRNDPGSAIWQAVALPMHEELGLGDGGLGFKLGGYAIPEAWNSKYVGVKY